MLRFLALLCAASCASAFLTHSPGKMPGLAFGAISRVRSGRACMRMGGNERLMGDRRDALARTASLFGAGVLVPWAADAADAEQGVVENVNYDLPNELDSWKGWNTQRSFERAGKKFEIEQRFADNRQNGMTVYEGNEAMTEYMEAQGRSVFRDKSVLELGTGTGLGSMVAFALGAKAVTATDRNPKVLELAEANFRRNFGRAGRRLQTKRLLWGADKCLEGERWKEQAGFCWTGVEDKFDIIIGSDLTYSEGVLPDLTKTLKDFMSRDTQVILVWCEPKLFTWNTDVMDKLNKGIATFDKYFDVEIVLWNKTYNSHPNTTIVKLRLNDQKPGLPGYPEEPEEGVSE